MKPLSAAIALAAASTFVVASPNVAHACGACFAPPTTPTVVSGHRMVMSISQEQTVLWDQIQYQGEPEDFAWVLPVKPGARIEEATDAFFEALEATTLTRVSGPVLNCSGVFGGGSYDGCSAGCGDDAAGDDGAFNEASRGTPPQNPVEVVHQGSVGPYETVTLSTMTPGALNTWLTEHGYNVDPASQPIIDQYVAEGYDFIALRLSPGVGVKQMKPVRIVMAGGGLTLPLRMVAIGTGAQTPIVLYLIGEGRYTIENLAEVSVPSDQLVWDQLTNSSNYESLRTIALEKNAGKSFLTSFAAERFFESGTAFVTGPAAGPQETKSFLQIYLDAARQNGEAAVSCDYPIGTGLASITDPCPGEDFDSPACTDVPESSTDARRWGCEGAYDVSRALVGMYPRDVWVTRTEMILPREALAADLTLRAAVQQPITSQLVADKSVNEDKACEQLGAAMPLWRRLSPPGRPMRAAPLIALGAAMTFVLRRLLRVRRWARTAA